ncbi:MAG: CRISPR-associated protein Cas4 [Anaerolineales bacterium]|nr:CRISPR-associated protein Cas4 [Anaerolineales bacterium]
MDAVKDWKEDGAEPPFRVTDLKQWVYCPRILYYHVCLPEVRPVTFKMEAGTEAGKGEEGREARRSLRAYGFERGVRAFGVALSSGRWGLRATLDMVIWPEGAEGAHPTEVIPVDYKLSKMAGEHFKLQLAAYAVLLEEAYDLPVKRGFLYYIPLRKVEQVPINLRLRERLQRELGAMQEMLTTERMPEPTPARARCVACEFRRFCNDV